VVATITNTDMVARKDLRPTTLGTDFTTSIAASKH